MTGPITTKITKPGKDMIATQTELIRYTSRMLSANNDIIPDIRVDVAKIRANDRKWFLKR